MHRDSISPFQGDQLQQDLCTLIMQCRHQNSLHCVNKHAAISCYAVEVAADSNSTHIYFALPVTSMAPCLFYSRQSQLLLRTSEPCTMCNALTGVRCYGKGVSGVEQPTGLLVAQHGTMVLTQS